MSTRWPTRPTKAERRVLAGSVGSVSVLAPLVNGTLAIVTIVPRTGTYVMPNERTRHDGLSPWRQSRDAGDSHDYPLYGEDEND